MSTSAAERDGELGKAGYWLTVAGIYFLVGVLFFYSGKGKLFDDDGHAPAAMKKQFEGTFIDKVPGVDTAWVILGVMELGIFVLLLVSLVMGEFLPHKRKTLLLAGLSLALLTFACLSFGQTSTGNNQGSASLYTYFGSTAVLILLVLRLSPSRVAERVSSSQAA